MEETPTPDSGPAAERQRRERAEEVYLRHLAESDEAREDLASLCARHADLADDLRALHAEMDALQRVRSRLAADGRALDPALRRLLVDVDRGSSFRRRFELGALIGTGGQGQVVEAVERALGRSVAIKTLRGDLLERAEAHGRGRPDQLLARFLAEAQITAQLDHPGVVAVHELALDEDGKPYFTMARVRGRDLRAVFADLRDGRLSLVRCLTILLRVCETMSFAHSRGIVHRDLKPANVMVGSSGEVYVMDWGLALASDAPAAGEPSAHDSVRTLRSESDSTALLETEPSQNVGTAFYMAPEVAEHGARGTTPAVDVYAVGAMLYELLAQRPPYAAGSEGQTFGQVLERIRRAPPPSLESLAPGGPPELLSIAARAMARVPSERYGDMHALEADLRAFLENRVVGAHATGPFEELRKWVARNRMLAGALATVLVVALGGLAAIASVQARGRAELDVQADLYRLPYLEAEARALWPETPAMVVRFEEWLRTAEALVARLDVHRAELEALRARAALVDAEARAIHRARSPLAAEVVSLDLRLADLVARDEDVGAEIEALERSRARLELALGASRPWSFADGSEQLRHDTLTKTVAGLEAFAAEDTGLLADVRRRLEWARSVEPLTIDACRAEWEGVARRVADETGAYAGLALAPILGLIPLGPDSTTGLEEFAFARSGALPTRDASGALFVDGTHALVLVLVPGGRFELGAQATSPGTPGYDRAARAEEGPVHTVALAPFLIAKHELTLGQWTRLGGRRPIATADAEDDDADAHPVDSVSWSECVDLLERFGLELPTEAQWEYAARARTDGPFLGHTDARGLVDSVNLADATVVTAGLGWPQARGMEWLDDGYLRHAPVGIYAPNAFGLHDVLGNVWEWCLDVSGPYTAPVYPATGLRVADPSEQRVARGGGYVNNATFARVSIRDMGRSRNFDSGYHGVRPALRLPR